ncbi:MAG: hypothetical protein A2017_00540 [Lentisphaerae bacterium GWF2_44_16]|nr:MAG: hypothetical protein A2017_00540 [Lentisphaerae bacterium GWF2_44_16]
MKAVIDKANGVPKYLQLKEILKKEIASMKRGDRFHTEHEIMKKYRLSFSTVSRAVRELAQAGLVERKAGKGTFIKSKFEKKYGMTDIKGQLLVIAGIESLNAAENPLNWFCHNEVQRGIVNSYAGPVRIITESEFIKGAEIESEMLILENPVPFVVERCRENGTCFVIINQMQNPEYREDSVNISHISGSFEALSYLIKELGHKRVAMITGGLATHSERIAAYHIALKTFNIPFEEKLFVKSEGGAERNGYEAMRKLLKLKEKPSAVFVDTDIKALGALRAVSDAGLKVPEDISVIGFDNMPDSASSNPPLTTVGGSYYEMGAEAVRLLEKKYAEKKKNIESILINTKLLIRKSCDKKK